MQDAPDQAAHAAQVLGAFIRRRAPKRHQPGELPAPPTLRRPAEDVQAALTALTRPTSRRHIPPGQLIDLAGLDLAGAQLYETKLFGAQLGEADLSGAWLDRADLTLAKGLTVAQLVAARLYADTRLPAEFAADPAVAARIEFLAAHPAAD